MSGIYDTFDIREEEAQRRVATPPADTRPEPSLAAQFGAASRTTGDEAPWVQKDRLRDSYGPLIDAVAEATRKRRRDYWTSDVLRFDVLHPTDYGKVWADIGRLSPDQRKRLGVPATRAEFERKALRRELEGAGGRTADQDVLARGEGLGSTVAQFGGGVWGSFKDPVNVALLPVGGGGRTVAMKVLSEIAIGAGATGLQLPGIAASREALGEELTAVEAIGAVAMGGVAAGAFKGAELGIGAAGRRLVTPEMRLARALANSVPAELRTPEQQAAIHVLTREGEIDAANPFAHTIDGLDEHAARIEAFIADFHEPPGTAPADPAVSAPRPLPIAPAEPGRLNMAQYLGQVRGAESSGNDAAAAATSSAFGRYQFTKATWLQFYKQRFGAGGMSDAAILAKRADGRLQDVLMADLTEANAGQLRRAGVPVTNASTYLAHFLGPADAIKVLRAADDAPVGAVVRGDSIAANRAVFDKAPTAGALRAWAARKMGGEPFAAAPVEPGTASEAIPRPAAMDATRPAVPDVAEVRPEVLDQGLRDVLGPLIADRKISVNDLETLATTLELEPGRVRGALDKLVEEGALRRTKSGIYRRRADRGPEDALRFVASRGGLSYDGLDPRLRDAVSSKGHDLKNTGNLDTLVPGEGPLLRPGGMGLDRAGELLHEAGFFGDPNSVPRPSESEVIALLDDSIRTKRKIFAVGDRAPERKPAAADFDEPAVDLTAAATAARNARFDEVAGRIGLPPMFPHEMEAVLALAERGTETLPPLPRDPLPEAEVLAPYAIEMVNREIDDVLAAAWLEAEDYAYDFQLANFADLEGGRASEGGAGSAADGGNADPGAAGARAGEGERAEGLTPSEIDDAIAAGDIAPVPLDEATAARFDEPAGDGVQAASDALWHDIRAQDVDPAIAARQKQQAELGAKSPMRGKTEQDGTGGLGLFDAANEPKFDLGDGSGPRTAAEIDAALKADEDAIATIDACLPKGGGA